MRLVVFLEQRFNQTPDGAVWTQAGYAYPFWRRYLEVFEPVSVAARVQPVAGVGAGWLRADGAGVTFANLPYYVGPRQYLMKLLPLRAAIRQAVQGESALIFRVPSLLASGAQSALKPGRPYGVEVVGDPYDVFAPGAVRHPLRPFFRWWFARQLRGVVAGACAAAYVTERTLQRRYPPVADGFTTSYSSIELPEHALARDARPLRPLSGGVKLVTVASLEQLYKGTDILLKAVSQCVARGLDARLTLVGDGKHRPEMEALAASLGLGERVCFLGMLPAGEAVRAQLDASDVFVLPSRTEGLPRAMVEAMARALPCIGSTAGGIPELLPAEDLVAPGDAGALADKIMEVATDAERMRAMSARNLATARRYGEAELRARRLAFYQYVKEVTLSWQRGKR